MSLRKLVSLSLLSLLILFTGCGTEEKPPQNSSSGGGQTTPDEPTIVSAEEGQKIWDDAFLKTQEHTVHQPKGTISIGVESEVTDNENDVLPPELEKMRGETLLNYDYTDLENAKGDFTIDLTFNDALEASVLFSAQLKDKKIDYVLKRFDEYAAAFFGVFDMLGGTEGVKAFQDEFVGKKATIELTEEQYNEVLKSIETANEEGEIVVNTEGEEQAIAKAFVDQQVFLIGEGGEIENGNYILPFSYSPEALIAFLNEVAVIMGVQNDFSGELDYFSKIGGEGTIMIDEGKTLLGIDAKITIDPSLSGSEKGITLDVQYKKEGETHSWKCILLDADSGKEQAYILVSYSWEEQQP